MRRRVVLGLGAGAALAASLGLRAEPTSGRAQFLSSVTWRHDHKYFGGVSGLELNADGTAFIAISDRGHILNGRLKRRGDHIHRIVIERFKRLRHTDGGRLPRFHYDAEGLAMAADGTLYVSFETTHRVNRYASPGATPVELPHHPDFAGQQTNSSFEMLAIGPDQALYTMPERSGSTTRPFPIYRFAQGRWEQPFSVPRRVPFLPVGADFGPDGRLYLLERHFTGIFGFASRVRRFDLTPEGLANEETLLETRAGKHDNLEGLTVWRDGAGRIRLTMVSDDNYRKLQRTEFVEYAVAE